MSNSPSQTTEAAVVALNNDDILCHVFEPNRPFTKRKLSRKDLLQCALVSRAFCEPALRALWADMSPPTPLWRLLTPVGSTFRETSECFDSVLSEKTYSDPVQWARFKWYARFVQELHITASGTKDKHKQLILALVDYNGGKSILPSLQTLWWSPPCYSDSSYFPLFTPQLRSAILSFPHSGADAPTHDPLDDNFLSQLQASSPRLDYLCVDASWGPLGADHLAIIPSFAHLTNLNLVVTISLTWFLKLATMPGMKSLRAAYVSSSEAELSQAPTQVHAPHLTLISIGGNCASLTHLFTALDAPRLAAASFHVMSDDSDGDADYISCIKAIATICPPADSPMEDFCIALDDDDGGPDTLEYLIDLLSPLLPFPNVTHFTLSCPMVGLVGDDYDFWAVAHAWPKLQTFELWQAYWDRCPGPARSERNEDEDSDSDGDSDEGSDGVGVLIPTPAALASFREFCPALRELVLPYLDFDAEVPLSRPWHVRGDATGAPHGLKVLAFGAKELGGEDDDEWNGGRASEPDEGQVAGWARYVLDLFPKLEVGQSLDRCRPMSTEEGWKDVLKRVRDLRKSRSTSLRGGAGKV